MNPNRSGGKEEMARRTTFLEAHGVPELLAPAGGPEPFNAALAAGADAIYCGLGNDFNARRGAKNFDDESFAAACRRAHLAGARVYVTVNVAISTEELPRVLELVRRAWRLGADAFIIQDWGLMAEIRRRWPEVETHVSTQANVHDARGVAWCRDVWGVDRVTLSRELSLAEISRIAEEGVELECFGHGALCFCYSGVCLMSSMNGGRSANRGLCAQPCRLPYDLVDEDGNVMEIPGVATQGIPETSRGVGGTRLLCPKDYRTVDRVREMRDAGVGSLKVEGRMKAPDYVFSVVAAYRDALDALRDGSDDDAARARRDRRLRRAFNRDFTESYLWGGSDNDMMSYERSNNRGELVGRVTGSRALEDAVVRRGGGNGGRERMRRLTRADVEVLLDQPVGAGDLLEIRPPSDPSQFLTAHAEADAAVGETITCRTSRPMEEGSLVRVIRSQAALDEAARVADKDVVRRRPVRVRVTARLGEPFSVELETSTALRRHVPRASSWRPRARARSPRGTSSSTWGAWARARLRPWSGTSRWTPAAACPSRQCTRCVPRRAVSWRRLCSRPMPTARSLLESPTIHTCRFSPRTTPKTPRWCVVVTTSACAEAALAAGATRIYASADDLARGSWPTGVIPWLDEVCREADHARLDPWVRAGEPVAVGNASELALAVSRGAAPEVRSCIPVHNASALAALAEAGAAGVWLSPELTLEEVCALARTSRVPVGLSVLGRERVMTSEHCVLQALGRCRHDCARCPERARSLSLRDIDGNLLPVRTDVNGRSRIWCARPLDATPQVGELVSAGVSRLLVDAQLMDAAETRAAVTRVMRALGAASAGRRPAPRAKGATSGHLFSPIG